MWPGPYGEWGSRKYLLASLDQSLTRLGLDHVDVFYSHRYDPDTPLEETMGALDHAVRQGKARYVGISSYSSAMTRRAAAILQDLGTPLLLHQPSYSMVNRWIEDDGLLDTLDDVGAGCIVFSPLAQGLLTDRYLDGIPEGSGRPRGRGLVRPGARHGREPREGPRAARARSRPGPVARTARARVDVARPARHLDPDRGQQRHTAGGQRRRARRAGLHRRRAHRHRRPRHRRWRQPVATAGPRLIAGRRIAPPRRASTYGAASSGTGERSGRHRGGTGARTVGDPDRVPARGGRVGRRAGQHLAVPVRRLRERWRGVPRPVPRGAADRRHPPARPRVHARPPVPGGRRRSRSDGCTRAPRSSGGGRSASASSSPRTTRS